MPRGLCRAIVLTILAAVGVTISLDSRAQDYPSRPVTIVVPLAAGSGLDEVARYYSDRLSRRIGKPFVVENRPGAATMIGTTSVMNAAPDGHTLLAATSSSMAINPVLYKQVAFDPNRDFVPISFYLKSPFVLCVHPGVPAKSVEELVKLARERPGPLSFGSPGAGTAQHLSVEYLKNKFSVGMTHVPYRSNPQYISDLVAGHINVAFVQVAAAVPLISQGTLRALAVSTITRLPILPDIPTLAEAAGDPEIETVSWHILFAPSATPRPIVDRLHSEMNAIIDTDEFRKHLLVRGEVPVDARPVEQIAAYVRSEQEKWGSLVRKLGLAGSQ